MADEVEQRTTRSGNMILTAFDKDDYTTLDTVCTQAIENPALPRYYRAQYEMFLAFVPGRNARAHLQASLSTITDMERVLEMEDRQREEVVRLKARVEDLMGSVVEEKVQIRTDQQEPLCTQEELEAEAKVKGENLEEEEPQVSTPEPPQTSTGAHPTSELSEMPLPSALVSSPQARPATSPMTSPSKLGKRNRTELESEQAQGDEEGEEGEGAGGEVERPGSPERKHKPIHDDA